MATDFHFLDCCVDLADGRLVRRGEIVPLRPKAFAVLAHLASRPGRLVTKQELLEVVWAETAVSDWVLTTCIKELRQALGEEPPLRRIIETAHRRGYRFLPEVRAGDAADVVVQRRAEHDSSQSFVVGRERELEQLGRSFESAARGVRQIVFIAGEAGIGKTTLVDEFIGRVSGAGDDSTACLARGHCVAQHGAGEAYMPVLEAMGTLCSGARGAEITDVMERHAPNWLVQLPGVLDPERHAALQARLPRGTRESMLREAAAFFASSPIPIVLVLEDLHWSDFGTLDLLTLLAGRRKPARLMLVATYRPVEVSVTAHPLKNIHRDMQARRACVDIWLGHLATDTIAAWLERGWPGLVDRERHAQVIASRTDGNPLFMVHLLDHLAATGALVFRDGGWRMDDVLSDPSAELPRGLRAMLATSLDRLDADDRSLLQTASAIGRSFRVDLLAAVVDADPQRIEQRVSEMADRELLVRRVGDNVWPDGRKSEVFELTHALFQQVLYRELSSARRASVNGRIAVCLEASWGTLAPEIATELAFHFEESGQTDRAIEALQAGAGRAFARAAHQDGMALLERALALLDAAPAAPARELAIIRNCIETGAAVSQLGSFGDPRAEAAFQRAHELAGRTDDLPQLLQAAIGLAGYFMATGQLARARAMVDEVHALAERLPFPAIQFGALLDEGMWQYHAGSLDAARRSLESALAIEGFSVSGLPIDVRCLAMDFLALILMHLGETEAALGRLAESRERAAMIGNPLDVAQAAMFECFVLALADDDEALAAAAERALGLATEYGAEATGSVARVCLGLLHTKRRDSVGMEIAREGIDRYRATKQLIALPFLLGTTARAALEVGDIDAAVGILDEIREIVETTGEHRFAAEAARIEGIIRQRRGDVAGAKAALGRAIEIARGDGSHLWERKAMRTLEECGAVLQSRS